MNARLRLSIPLKMSLALAAGLALGWGRLQVSASRPQDSAATPAAGSSRFPAATSAGRSQPAGAAAPAATRDLAGVDRLLAASSLSPDALNALQHLSTASLQDLLRSRLPGGEKINMSPRLRLDLRSAVAAELYHRGSEASFQWASQLPSGEQGLAFLLMPPALHDDPALARSWLDRLGSTWGASEVGYMVQRPYQEAISRDAASALEYESLFVAELKPDSENPLGPYRSASFPAGFDYHRFIAGTQIPASARASAIAWAILDPEAAFTGLSAEIPGRPELLGRLAEGVSATRGEDAATLWLSEKLSRLPSGLRDQAAAAAAKIPAFRPPATPPH